MLERMWNYLGSYTCFWDSPKLQTFWETIKSEITVVLDVDLQTNPYVGMYAERYKKYKKMLFLGCKINTLEWNNCTDGQL